jgi:hypothetical protein
MGPHPGHPRACCGPPLTRGAAPSSPTLAPVAQCRGSDKKENQIFLIDKKIQSGAVAMSYMRKGFLIYLWGNAQIFPHIRGGRWSYMTLQLLHSEFPYTVLYMRKIWFSFSSVRGSDFWHIYTVPLNDLHVHWGYRVNTNFCDNCIIM